MSLKQLQEGAILIADAHCAPWRTDFIDFLHALEAKTIQTPQLILMGDVLDMLYGPIKRTYIYNESAIKLLNKLATSIEIIYLEGNHDFRLHDIFPDIKIIPRPAQPFIMKHGLKSVALSHGDSHMDTGYEIYTFLIRNRLILETLRFIDNIGGGFIVYWLEKSMRKKSHCRRIEHFKEIIERRIDPKYYKGIDILIEGHFHQNSTFRIQSIEYINLAAFACNERYFTVQSIDNQPILLEAMFQKEPK